MASSLPGVLEEIFRAEIPVAEQRRLAFQVANVCVHARHLAGDVQASGLQDRFEEVLDCIAQVAGREKVTVTQAKERLRSQGPQGAKLASRVSKLSKGRSSGAHPDVALPRDIASLVSGSGIPGAGDEAGGCACQVVLQVVAPLDTGLPEPRHFEIVDVLVGEVLQPVDSFDSDIACTENKDENNKLEMLQAVVAPFLEEQLQSGLDVLQLAAPLDSYMLEPQHFLHVVAPLGSDMPEPRHFKIVDMLVGEVLQLVAPLDSGIACTGIKDEKNKFETLQVDVEPVLVEQLQVGLDVLPLVAPLESDMLELKHFKMGDVPVCEVLQLLAPLESGRPAKVGGAFHRLARAAGRPKSRRMRQRFDFRLGAAGARVGSRNGLLLLATFRIWKNH